MKKYNYQQYEVAWLKSSVKDGLPTEAVGIHSISNDGLLTVYKTKETKRNKFEIQAEELMSSEEACKMADLKTKMENRKRK